ncbi:DUF1842 domain-containing protein [Chromobacterium sphagni]|uniref:DUF1842 domain-containing protein n=1 Tax=Chromobacterium sphagni TaxID=1903179 RepID=A0A1S1WZJ2_9NEIS|nr:DUF1842 domain-containing protein [Chromobacterium sphagni]OHX12717.1 hypothetical protein BI347_03775 [Chromobacterium sphagni]OHX21135.1 hypothetical protein BI344_00905 [Chromobacterium sphagni]
MANQLDRDQKAGLFIVSYNVSKPGVAGGYNLQLKLSVYPPSRRVSGEAVITHATAQPLVFKSPVHGHYEENGSNIELFLAGHNLLQTQGQQGQQQAHALPGEDFHFDGHLKGGWQADAGSKARYAFLQHGHWTEVIGQDIQLSDELRHTVKSLNLR